MKIKNLKILDDAFLIQSSNILLMLTQSLLIPYIIGLGDYGRQMLQLAPIFLIQSLNEPYFQAYFNDRNSKKTKIKLNSTLILIILSTLSYCIFFKTSYSLLLLLTLYIFYTSILSFFYSLNKLNYIGPVVLISTFFYITLFISLYSYIENEILFSLLGFYLFSCSIFIFIIVKKYEITLKEYDFSLNYFVRSSSFKLPVTLFGNLTLIILGGLGINNRVIGEFKLFLAAVNSAKHFNLIPVGHLYVTLKNNLNSQKNFFQIIEIKKFILSLIIYSMILTIILPIVLYLLFDSLNFYSILIIFTPFYYSIQPSLYIIFLKTPAFFNFLFYPIILVAIMTFMFTMSIILFKNPYLGFASASFFSGIILFFLFFKNYYFKNVNN